MTERSEVLPKAGATLTPGVRVHALCPMGVRREVRIDHVHGNGLVAVSYALPRGRGRRTWTTEAAWLETDGAQEL